MIKCWFDGAAWPNPGGRGGFGALIQIDGRLVWEGFGYIGHGPQISNNVAEYAGAIVVMRQLIQRKIKEAAIYGDSNMVCRQMNGKGRSFNKEALYYPYFLLAREYRAKLPNIRFQWIPREQNEEADVLSKLGINDKVIHPVLTLGLDGIFAEILKSKASPISQASLLDTARNAAADCATVFPFYLQKA